MFRLHQKPDNLWVQVLQRNLPVSVLRPDICKHGSHGCSVRECKSYPQRFSEQVPYRSLLFPALPSEPRWFPDRQVPRFHPAASPFRTWLLHG